MDAIPDSGAGPGAIIGATLVLAIYGLGVASNG
jgi:hypothetical protein